MLVQITLVLNFCRSEEKDFQRDKDSERICRKVVESSGCTLVSGIVVNIIIRSPPQVDHHWCPKLLAVFTNTLFLRRELGLLGHDLLCPHTHL